MMEALGTDVTEPAGELFGTETMAELCARQGRVRDAVAIYRRLVVGAKDDRRSRLLARLAQLERTSARAVATSGAPAEVAAAKEAARLAVTVEQPVRGGQVVRAERADLVVLAPVNPGAQLIADGHIHVYAALRGQAIAGAQGHERARIFCQRLEAELVGISGVYATYEDIPRECRGRPAQVFLADGRCVIRPL